MTAKTTHDEHAKQFETPYAEPPANVAPTSHDLQAERYVDHFTSAVQISSIADLLMQITEPGQADAISETQLATIEKALASNL